MLEIKKRGSHLQKGLLLLLVLVILVIAGCGSFSTINAVEYVADFYDIICPGGSKSNILVTKPYKNGMLVLAKNSVCQNMETLELFIVDKNGVSKLATGLTAGEGKFSLNRSLEGNSSILFGQFTVDSKENTELKYTKVIVTLENWKIISQGLTDVKGFILILNHTDNVEKFDLYGAEGTVLAELDDLRMAGTGLHQTDFVSINDFPLPFPLVIDDINEVRVEIVGKTEKEMLVLGDREDYQQLVSVLNEHFESLVKIVHLPNTDLEVVFSVDNGDKMILRRAPSSPYIVSYQKGEQVSHYLLGTADLTAIVNGLEKKLAEKVAEGEIES